MLQIAVVNDGKTVELKGVPVSPRTFSVRDAEGKVVEGATGSVGYGVYAPVMIDGLRHQLTVNVVVNKSKLWTDEQKLAWIGAAMDTEVDFGGYADTFRNKANSGWRINSQGMVGGVACTFSGSLVLSGKTIKAAGAKAAKAAAREVKLESAAAKHEAAMQKSREARDKALAALKASVKA